MIVLYQSESLLGLGCSCIITSLSLGGFSDKLILLPNLSYYASKNSFLDEEASGYQLPLNYKVYQGNNQAKVRSLF